MATPSAWESLPVFLPASASPSAGRYPNPMRFPRQFLQVRLQPRVLLPFTPTITVRRSCQSHQPAGVPVSYLVLDFDVAHGCPKSRRRFQFFESTSFSARLSSVSSATTCFSLRFSSSSCFSFFASPLSIPPYFAFQR